MLGEELNCRGWKLRKTDGQVNFFTVRFEGRIETPVNADK